MLEAICGCGPVPRRVGAWLDAHPVAALLVLALAVIACGLLEGSL